MAPVPKFETNVPQTKHCIVSFPRPNVVLVKLNRARDLNCINMEGHAELDAIWNWMDAEGALTCGIITGEGRAFSAGADLKGCSVVKLFDPLTNDTLSKNGTRRILLVAREKCVLRASLVCLDVQAANLS